MSPLDIVLMVSERRIPRATGVLLLAAMVPSADPEATMGEVGRTFFVPSSHCLNRPNHASSVACPICSEGSTFSVNVGNAIAAVSAEDIAAAVNDGIARACARGIILGSA